MEFIRRRTAYSSLLAAPITFDQEDRSQPEIGGSTDFSREDALGSIIESGIGNSISELLLRTQQGLTNKAPPCADQHGSHPYC